MISEKNWATNWADQYSQKRAVRGLAVVDDPLEPTLLSFERENIQKPEILPPSGFSRFSYAQLEAWKTWETAQLEAPLHLLGNMTVLYDPTGFLVRIQKMLQDLEPTQLYPYQKRVLSSARVRLQQAQKQRSQPGHQLEQQIESLVLARGLLRNHLYPALFSRHKIWFESRLHFPESLRQIGAISQPKAVYQLEGLYGFGGESLAKKLIQATRGLSMTGVEKAANRALERGYYDGVVMFLRDHAAQARAEDIGNWRHLSHARQQRLTLLLGLEHCPLGVVALERVEKALLEVENSILEP
jgi:hypothetical protein